VRGEQPDTETLDVAWAEVWAMTLEEMADEALAENI
jgi:hypothetical protein